MLFDKRELRQLCINNDKEHYIRYIERYLSLSAQEKIDLWEKATMYNVLKKSLFAEETWGQKTVRIIRDNLPHNIAKYKWFEAFLFFDKYEKKEMSKIYKRMGLPKNGIRPDDCQ